MTILACLLLASLCVLSLLVVRPLLSLWFLGAPLPYLVVQIAGNGRWPEGIWVWWVGALHVAMALECCWLALERGSERRCLLHIAVLAGIVGGLLVALGDPLGLSVWLTRWYVLTTASAVAVAAGSATGVYLGETGRWRAAAGPLLVAAYFFVDVAVNALYRYTEYVRDFNRLMLGVDHAWNLGVVLVAIWMVGRKA